MEGRVKRKELLKTERKAMEREWLSSYEDPENALPMNECGSEARDFEDGWLAARKFYTGQVVDRREVA